MIVILLFLIGVYSYTQIDPNLTLFNLPWLIELGKWGYFNRSLSLGIFIALTLVLIFYYLKPPKNTRLVLAGLFILGIFSYPIFSHDIFNYIFDARILVFHQANPYTSTALMFPLDEWTRFMQWTHRTYPYGPLFIPISALFYVFGLNKFILTLVAFKTMMSLSFVGSCYYIKKISGQKAMLLFALNPLIVYEVLVAGHMDIVMLFFALAALYRKNIFLMLCSAGIKFVTLMFIPLQFLKSKIWWFIAAAYFGVLLQFFSRELLPHYFIVPIGFSALLPNNKKLIYFSIIISGLLLFIRYVPFLLTGNWFTLSI